MHIHVYSSEQHSFTTCRLYAVQYTYIINKMSIVQLGKRVVTFNNATKLLNEKGKEEEVETSIIANNQRCM